MREVAADGAAIADLRMRDVRQRLVDERQVARGGGVALQAAIAGQRADAQASRAIRRDPGAIGQRVDVDQHCRLRQPEIHCRNKTLAAGEKSRFIAMFGLQLQGLIEAAGGDVVEGRRFHVAEGYQKLGRCGCAPVWKRARRLVKIFCGSRALEKTIDNSGELACPIFCQPE